MCFMCAIGCQSVDDYVLVKIGDVHMVGKLLLASNLIILSHYKGDNVTSVVGVDLFVNKFLKHAEDLI